MSNVIEQIEQQIAKLSTKAVKKNTGNIRTVADGVAKIEGLSDVMYNEMVQFPGGAIGIAFAGVGTEGFNEPVLVRVVEGVEGGQVVVGHVPLALAHDPDEFTERVGVVGGGQAQRVDVVLQRDRDAVQRPAQSPLGALAVQPVGLVQRPVLEAPALVGRPFGRVRMKALRERAKRLFSSEGFERADGETGVYPGGQVSWAMTKMVHRAG